MFETATLVTHTYTTDSLNQRVPGEPVTVSVPVTKKSVSRDELTVAGEFGLNDSCMFETNIVNYSGQEELIYGDRHYTIYRTYKARNSNNIELYCKAKRGVTQ